MDLNGLFDKVLNGVSHIIMGDFNFNLLDLSSQNGDFLNFMIENDLYPLVNIPTRITSQSASIVDNAFLRSIDLNRSFSDAIMFPGSDHFQFSAKICCSVKRVQKKTKISTDEKKKTS